MENREIARLLAGRNEPSVLEKEAAFEELMKRVSHEKRRRGLLFGGLALAAAAFLAVVSQRDAEFGTRGGGHGALALKCIPPGDGTRCVAGGKLTLDVGGSSSLYFAAFARRSDGTIVWYWPSASGSSPPVASFAHKRAPHTAIQLDAAHPAGPYEVYGVFSARPLDRTQLKKALGDELRGDGTVEVLRRTFTVVAP